MRRSGLPVPVVWTLADRVISGCRFRGLPETEESWESSVGTLEMHHEGNGRRAGGRMAMRREVSEGTAACCWPMFGHRVAWVRPGYVSIDRRKIKFHDTQLRRSGLR